MTQLKHLSCHLRSFHLGDKLDVLRPARWNSRIAFLEELDELLAGQRRRDEITLALIDTAGDQGANLVFGLDAFRDHGHMKIPGERDQHFHDRRGRGVHVMVSTKNLSILIVLAPSPFSRDSPLWPTPTSSMATRKP